jgi:hypothetical protein
MAARHAPGVHAAASGEHRSNRRQCAWRGLVPGDVLEPLDLERDARSSITGPLAQSACSGRHVNETEGNGIHDPKLPWALRRFRVSRPRATAPGATSAARQFREPLVPLPPVPGDRRHGERCAACASTQRKTLQITQVWCRRRGIAGSALGAPLSAICSSRAGAAHQRSQWWPLCQHLQPPTADIRREPQVCTYRSKSVRVLRCGPAPAPRPWKLCVTGFVPLTNSAPESAPNPDNEGCRGRSVRGTHVSVVEGT